MQIPLFLFEEILLLYIKNFFVWFVGKILSRDWKYSAFRKYILKIICYYPEAFDVLII
jgi:hypothetical protein